MSTRNHKTSLIIVDFLSFTVSLSAFRHLERAGSSSTKDYRWEKLPKQSFKKVKNHDVRNQLVEDYQAQMRHVLFKRCEQFLSRVMGLTMSTSKGKGLHGYVDHSELHDSDGKGIYGKVGYGGNNDTIFITINGQGCRRVFEKLSPFVLHFWLSKVLTVTKLSRIDLAYDDFDGNYDADYAIRAHADHAFKSSLGGRQPVRGHICNFDSQGKSLGETITVGSRQSTIYWRIYDKAAEQKVQGIWWRNEVELKKVTVDVLENPAIYYASINAFSNSINLESPPRKLIAKKRAVLDFNGKIQWARQQCGKILSDIAHAFDGDIAAAYGAVCNNEGGKLSISDTQAEILNSLRHYAYLSETEPLQT